MTTRPPLQSGTPHTGTHRHSVAEPPVVFGTGLIALDVILSADPTRPPLLAAGGTCGNVLTALSFLGWEAFPVARLNEDPASELVRTDLARWNVALDFAAQMPPAETPIIIQRNKRSRDGTLKHRFSLACPACGAWFPSFRAVTADAASEVVDAVAAAAPSGFVPRVFFLDRVSRGALMLAKAFADWGALVVFEPIGVGNPKLFTEALALAHVLKYSHERLPDLAVRRLTGRNLLLEIETLGSEGLRYRSKLLPTRSWRTLDAVPASALVDTAGAGDWCTAGLLATLAPSGLIGAETARARDIAEALRFGQAAATIACGYEGARGVMEALDRDAFDQTVTGLLAGETTPQRPVSPGSEQAVGQRTPAQRHEANMGAHMGVGDVCPACP